MNEPLMTVDQTAEICNVSAWLIRERIAAGDMPCVRIGRAIRVRPEALAAWLGAQEAGGLDR